MALQVARFSSLFFVALAFAPATAHLLELLNKIDLPREEYLIVQHIYDGWALLGFVVFGALASTLALAVLTRHRRREFVPALVAFLCVVVTQVVFWTFTFPANKATGMWTMLPANWEALRVQWEYSHAASALISLAALVAVILAVLRKP